MRIALMADIHANLEAFAACLADAEAMGAARLILLGDLVGYGADPNAVIALAQARAALAILGNHDAAAIGAPHRMTADAATAIAWTAAALSAPSRAWLATLPMEAVEEDRLYVHAEASRPAAWRYVTDAEAARQSIEATDLRLTFTGHTHQAAIFALTAADKITRFRPTHDASVPLLRPRRWFCCVGAVGQPRDGNPAACYALFDTGSATLTIRRIPYDIAMAAEKIRAAGLPERLASRLFQGG